MRLHTMNRYGLLAKRHMQEYLPAQYATIEDPDRYFAELGEEISNQVAEVASALEGPSPADEDYMATVGRLRMARLMAEEKVLAEMAFLPPEPGSDPEEPETDETGAYV
ncbi:MAG: hypothetical protein ACRDYC_08490, partial [Acidimicrobiales bacterium]